MKIILLATAWGPKFGGINSFNEDFALGLAAYFGPGCENIFCLVPRCSTAEMATAAASGVKLLKVREANKSDRPFDKIAGTILPSHPDIPEIRADDIWVGHDIVTGAAAIDAAQASGSKSALIMHMNQEAYKGIQDSDSREGHRRFQQQRNMFNRADLLFAVGPLLRRALKNMVDPDAQVHMLVPGLPDIPPRTVSDELRGIAFGRLDRRNDIVKQGSLVAAGFGLAVRKMQESKDNNLDTLTHSFKMFGAFSRDEEVLFQGIADENAGGIAPVAVLPYENDRTEIFDALGRANLAIVPSLHDGFALTGWEAIAAETPLILSQKTGLWELLAELWSPTIARAVVQTVLVHGARPGTSDVSYTSEDVDSIAGAIVDAMKHREERIRVACDLKQWLLEKRDGCTWERTAEDFLIGVGAVSSRALAEEAFIGDWIGFFIEGSPLRPAEVVEERIRIRRRRNGRGLEGSSGYVVAGQDRAEAFTSLSARGGVLNGHTTAKSGYTRDSWCQFQVARRSEGRLLDGVVSWSSTVETAVDWSRYIWVRDEPGNEELIAFASEEMVSACESTQRRVDWRKGRPYPA